MTNRDKLLRAKRRVDEITGFCVHLTAFAAVMAVLLALNVAYDPEWWVQWPFLGWGIGIFGPCRRRVRPDAPQQGDCRGRKAD